MCKGTNLASFYNLGLPHFALLFVDWYFCNWLDLRLIHLAGVCGFPPHYVLFTPRQGICNSAHVTCVKQVANGTKGMIILPKPSTYKLEIANQKVYGICAVLYLVPLEELPVKLVIFYGHAKETLHGLP